jgi:hypothetical protein
MESFLVGDKTLNLRIRRGLGALKTKRKKQGRIYDDYLLLGTFWQEAVGGGANVGYGFVFDDADSFCVRQGICESLQVGHDG